MTILFIRFSSLGDVILTTGVLKQIAENMPGGEINILTFEEYIPVFDGLGFINEVFAVPRSITLNDYKEYLRFMPTFDYIGDWHDNIRSRVARSILKGRAWTYKKQSLCRRLYAKFRLCRDKLAAHTVLRYAAFLPEVLGLPLPELELLRPVLAGENAPMPDKIVIHPFASRYTKIWPYFPELTEKLAGRGYKVTVIGKGEFPVIAGVERVETPELKDMFRVLSDAELVISTDSGPMHAAVGLGRALAAIFGSTTRELGFFPLFTACAIIENTELRCRPCHVHGLGRCPKKHFKCMRDLTVAEVLSRLPLIR